MSQEQEQEQPIEPILRTIMAEHGFDHFGWAPLTPALSMTHYELWLKRGFHGDMAYLERHLPIKKALSAHSAIVVAAFYKPAARAERWDAKAIDQFQHLNIASYARIDDYHVWLTGQLNKAAHALKQRFRDEEFSVATDSKPILERDLAYRAGLGWVGKNSCVIDERKGSYFLIGEIVTSLRLPVAGVTAPDRCGRCRRCMDACPTQAIVEPRVVDARKCISYLTIESKSVPAPELRKSIGSHFFGCDICQDVCPWNQKVISPTIDETPKDESPTHELIGELRWILDSSSKSLERALEHTPLSRARGFGLKRNAIVIAGNLRLRELKDKISRYLTDPRLGELASWALHEID